MNTQRRAATLRLGTRRSPLARTQSQHVAAALAAACGRAVELVDVVTHGDRTGAPLHTMGGAGVFVSALRESLSRGEVDLAVHSLKDLPTAPAEGLTVAAVPSRVDPRDALVARDGLRLDDLPAGARIGTGSPRRVAQLLHLGRGLSVRPTRGNIGTRLAMVRPQGLDAVVLAAAGLERLGLSDQATELLEPHVMVPAPGQGALAVECRAEDGFVREVISALDDPDTRAAVTAERAFLAALEAGCSAPVGALATIVHNVGDPQLRLEVAVGADTVLRRSATGSAGDPTAVGEALAGAVIAEIGPLRAGRLLSTDRIMATSGQE